MIDVRRRTFTETVKATVSLHFLIDIAETTGKESGHEILLRKFLGGDIDG
ncbi:hypothetical protein [Pyrococcus kukulkanii]